MTQNLLTRIEISDFRSFGNFSLDLPRRPGVTILTGSNGLGKSNFFDALEWAVTGDVRRLARHRSRRVTEADYLTREGAPRGSHRVSLLFSDGNEIRRGGGNDTPPASITATLVDPGWAGEVEDLSVFLGLTHFLGQSSEQRFMSRQGREQWEALKGPAGVERVEALRNRIGGRGARLAFNRRIEAEQNVLRRDQEALARWDSRVQQLRRLQRTASAAGVLSPDRILEEARALAARVELHRLAPSIGPIGDAAPMLDALREALEAAARRIALQSAGLDEATVLAERFAEIGTEIARIDADRPGASEEARAAIERTEQALRNLHQENAVMGRRSEALQRLKGHVEMLRSARADKATLAAATAAAAAAKSAVAPVEAELSRAREQRKDTETVYATAQALHTQAPKLAAASQQAIAMAERARALETAEARVAIAAANTVAARLGEDDLVRSEEDLKRHRETLQETVRQHEDALVEARRKASEMTRAVSILAAHISVNDPNCPICSTPFPPGELKRLASSAASTQDAELARLEAELASISSDLAAVDRELRHIEEARGVVLAATAAETGARVTAERIRREIASAYPIVVPDVPVLKEAAAAQLAETERQVAETTVAIAELPAPLGELSMRATEAAKRVEELEATIEEWHQTAANHAQDQASAAARLAERLAAVVGVTPDRIEAALDEGEAAQSAAAAEFDQSLEAHRAAANRLVVAKQEQDAAERRLSRLDADRENLGNVREQLRRDWLSLEFPGEPSGAGLEDRRSSLRRAEAERALLLGEHGRLAAALEASMARVEVLAIRQSLDEELARSGSADFDAERARLAARILDAETEVKDVETVRRAALGLADRMQVEAQRFSLSILEPLNGLIDSFNTALLTNPGTSVFFSADLHADRTAFNMGLRRRRWIDDEAKDREISPQLFLSEGELAANGFSILCSASVSYPWSRWRVLLLDDPLQHNDIIHAAAFVDLMRNLVEILGYEIVVSSHHRAETEFMERKFSVAKLPCTVCRLVSATPEGVQYEVSYNSAAKTSLDQPEFAAL